MKKIMFSLPIHEQPEVVYEQIFNITHYNPDSLIVLHINPIFHYSEQTKNYEDLVSKLSTFQNVYINPNRLEVGFNNIIQAHISNYDAVKNVDFDYFYFVASNELFLRSGVCNFIEKFNYGCQDKLNEDWAFIDCLKSDQDLKGIMKDCNTNDYSYSQIEGSFYSKEIMENICTIIKNNFDYKKQEVSYPREEVYFPTIANALFKNVSHFDDCCCQIRWEAGVLFTSIQSVKKVAAGGEDNYKFSVKRIDRDYNNYLRYYIRNNICNYSEELRNITNIQEKKHSLVSIHFINTYYLIIYFVRRRMALVYHKITNTHAD